MAHHERIACTLRALANSARGAADRGVTYTPPLQQWAVPRATAVVAAANVKATV